MDRDRFMSAEEAKAYGLIDSVFTPRKDLVPHSRRQEGDLTRPGAGVHLSGTLPPLIATRLHVQRQAPPLLLLREIEGLGPEVHLRPVGLHLQ